MSRLERLLKLIGLRPGIAIQFVLAIVIITYGLFTLTFYDPTSQGLAAFFNLVGMRIITSLVYIIPGLISLAGTFGLKRQGATLCEIGTFGMFLGYMSYVILRFLTGAISPWTWLFPLGLAVISGILHLSAKWLE